MQNIMLLTTKNIRKANKKSKEQANYFFYFLNQK